jgi:uncharacterized Tic20 family protein
MIDFTNYTPAPAKEALVQGSLGDVGRDRFTDMMMHLFPGVMSSALLSLILLILFIIGLPLVIWLLQTGRVKNG